MVKLLKDLALALLNATLLLAAIGLFFAWRVTSTMDGMVATFAGNLEIVTPLREDVQAMTTELAALRNDISALKSQTGEVSSATLRMVEDRVEKMESRVEEARNSIDDLKQAPDQMVDHAIEKTMQTAADEFSRAINDIRNCQPAG